jgi:hypothetical protein
MPSQDGYIAAGYLRNHAGDDGAETLRYDVEWEVLPNSPFLSRLLKNGLKELLQWDVVGGPCRSLSVRMQQFSRHDDRNLGIVNGEVQDPG